MLPVFYCAEILPEMLEVGGFLIVTCGAVKHLF